MKKKSDENEIETKEKKMPTATYNWRRRRKKKNNCGDKKIRAHFVHWKDMKKIGGGEREREQVKKERLERTFYITLHFVKEIKLGSLSWNKGWKKKKRLKESLFSAMMGVVFCPR